MDATPRYERRIGTRRPTVPPIELEWATVGPAPLRDRAGRPTGHILDISVTGAAIEAVSSAALKPGQWVSVRYRGHDGEVVVERVVASDRTGMSVYGVRFAALSPELTQAFYDLVARDRPDQELQRVWTGTF